jgi:hypothetical protein
MAKNVEVIDWASPARKAKRDNDLYINRDLKKLMTYREYKNQPVNVLSLPAEKWLWESQLIQNFPNNKINFLGTESNPVVYKKSLEVAATINGKNVKTELLPNKWEEVVVRDFNSRMFNSTNAGFDIIYGDFMGTFNRGIIGYIEELLSDTEMLKPLGNIIFTFMLARGWQDIREETIKIGEKSAYRHQLYVDDDKMWLRHTKNNTSDLVHTYALGIMETVVLIAKKFGKVLIPAKPHVYYSPGANGAELPEGSFCFTRLK